MRDSSLDTTASPLQEQLEDLGAALAALDNLTGFLQRLLDAEAGAKSGKQIERVIESLASVAETFSSSVNALNDALEPFQTISELQQRHGRQLDEIESQLRDLMGWLGAPPRREAEPTS